jgi:hypothetical protein
MVAPELFRPHPPLLPKPNLPLSNKWCVPTRGDATRRGTTAKKFPCWKFQWNPGLSFTLSFEHAVSNRPDGPFESKEADPVHTIEGGEPKKTTAAIVWCTMPAARLELLREGAVPSGISRFIKFMINALFAPIMI